MSEGAQARLANWIQFALLLLALLTLALHGEGRLARVEQRLDDDEKTRAEMLHTLNRIEDKLATWPVSHN